MSSTENVQRTAIIFDERMLLHKHDKEDHPEMPFRLQSILERFNSAGLTDKCTLLQCDSINDSTIVKVHSPELLDFAKSLASRSSEDLEEAMKTLDSLYLCTDTELSARVAAACTCKIAVEVCKGKYKNGFALVRPPGHHAEPEKAMGFCIYNNVAIAVRELQRLKLTEKTLIFDWDVHHGNGTQKVFVDDPNVLFISIHRHDDGHFYPVGLQGSPEMVGNDPAKGKTINIGWNGPGATDVDYFAAFSRIILPIVEEFQPDFIVVSAGFDASAGDPIGNCLLSPRAYAQMTKLLMSFAQGKILLVLEGGYNIPVITDCAEACLRILLGEEVEKRSSGLLQPSIDAEAAIFSTLVAQRPYWKTLRPKCYEFPYHISNVFPLQCVIDVFWKEICIRNHNLIPMPISDGELSAHFTDRVFISENLLASPETVILFAHESGLALHRNLNSNIVDSSNSDVHFPFLAYLKKAISENCAIIDVSVPLRTWELKQTSTGASDVLPRINDLLLYIWDFFLSLCECQRIFIISSGLPSYAVCTLIDQRVIQHKVLGVVVISPTLYLPVSTPEKSDWYQKSSLVFIPTRKAEGSEVHTNPAFGNCISSGSDDPNEISLVISRCRDRIFNFIEQRKTRPPPKLDII